MKGLFIIVLLLSSMSSAYLFNTAKQVAHVFISDTTKTPPGGITTNDSANLTMYVQIDTATTVITGTGKWRPFRINSTTLVNGWYSWYPTGTTEYNGRAVTLIPSSSTANYYPTIVDMVYTDTVQNMVKQNYVATQRDSTETELNRLTVVQDSLKDRQNRLTVVQDSLQDRQNRLTVVHDSLQDRQNRITVVQDSTNDFNSYSALTNGTYGLSNIQSTMATAAKQTTLASSISGDSNNVNALHTAFSIDSAKDAKTYIAVNGDSTNNLTNTKTSVWTSTRAGYLDSLATSLAKAATALSNVTWTAARAGYLDSLNANVASRAPASTALSTATWTGTRAGYLDSLNANIASRAPASSALSTAQWTNTRAGYLDSLAVSLAKAATALSSVSWTTARAGYLDSLDAKTSSRAPANTALSNATWTGARAGYLDTLSGNVLMRTVGYVNPDTVSLHLILHRTDTTTSSRSSPSVAQTITPPGTMATLANQVIIAGITRPDSLLNATNWPTLLHRVDTTVSSRSTGSSGAAPTVTQIDSTLSQNHGNSTWGIAQMYANTVVAVSNVPGVALTFKNTSGNGIQLATIGANDTVITTLPNGKIIGIPYLSGYTFALDTFTVAGNTTRAYTGTPISVIPPPAGLQDIYVMKTDLGFQPDSTTTITGQISQENVFSGGAVITGKPIVWTNAGTYYYMMAAKGAQVQVIGKSSSKEFLNMKITITQDASKSLSSYLP